MALWLKTGITRMCAWDAASVNCSITYSTQVCNGPLSKSSAHLLNSDDRTRDTRVKSRKFNKFRSTNPQIRRSWRIDSSFVACGVVQCEEEMLISNSRNHTLQNSGSRGSPVDQRGRPTIASLTMPRLASSYGNNLPFASLSNDMSVRLGGNSYHGSCFFTRIQINDK